MSLSPRSRVDKLLSHHRLRRLRLPEAVIAAHDLPNEPLAGLSPDVAERVIDLESWRKDRCDLVAMATLLVQGIATISWPDPPATLPTGSPIPFTAVELAESDDDDRQSQQLDELEAEPERFASWNEEDRAPLVVARRRVRRRALVPDRLAFYRSFATGNEAQTAQEAFSLGGRWGIYLLTGGIERLAQEVFLPLEMDDHAALRCATAMLLGHEVGHLLVDLALAEADVARWPHDDDTVQTALAVEHRASDDGFCRAEEAFCEAYALQFLADALARDIAGHGLLRFDPDKAQEVLAAAREHVAAGLPGYRAGADIDDLFSALIEVLQHAGVEDPEHAALLADLDRRTVTTADVPVRLVVSPGSAYGAEGWFTPADSGL